MTEQHLRSLREYEFTQVHHYLHPGMSVLEIGSGRGWQMQLMKQLGVKVIPVEIQSQQSTRPPILYDGSHLPIRSNSVDLIFSSNTLEHIDSLAVFQQEMRRVLKPEGRAIHILPTPTWRFWTFTAHYLHRLKRSNRKIALPCPTKRTSETKRNHFLPERHGLTGNILTEHYYFSRIHWVRHFRETGWRVTRIYPTKLFYTGYSLLDARLSLRARHSLSYFAGSSCAVYVLQKA